MRLGTRRAAGAHRQHAVSVRAAFTLVSPDGSKKTYEKVQQQRCLHVIDLTSGRAAGIACTVPWKGYGAGPRVHPTGVYALGKVPELLRRVALAPPSGIGGN